MSTNMPDQSQPPKTPSHLAFTDTTHLNHLTIFSYLAAGSLLLLTLLLKLIGCLLAGLLVYQLICKTAPFIEKRASNKISRWISAVFVATMIIALFTGLAIGIIGHIEHAIHNMPALLNKTVQIIEQTRLRLPEWIGSALPIDAAQIKFQSMNLLNEHLPQLQQSGKSFATNIGYIVLGMIIGAMIAVDSLITHRHKPLAKVMIERIQNLSDSFHRIVFAQIKISAINAFLTGIYLLIFLPLLHEAIPLSKTLVLVTFLVGLLTIIGNLISNTLIVAASLSINIETAIFSLIFLVVIHKLEYFLNAKIMGTKVGSKAWEILLVMLIFQAIFGITGVIAAPIFYGYLKIELRQLKLI